MLHRGAFGKEDGKMDIIAAAAFPLFFSGIGLYVNMRNLLKNSYLDVGMVFEWFPDKYVIPPRWIRKLFHMPKKHIPKYLYFGTYLGVFNLISAPIFTVIAFLVENAIVLACLFLFLIFSNLAYKMLVLFLFEPIYKKKAREQNLTENQPNQKKKDEDKR